ncbi:hypothetical protein ABZW49_47730 [Nonomuraea wenchangensis]
MFRSGKQPPSDLANKTTLRLHLPDLPVIDVTAGVRGGVSTRRAAIAAYAAGRPLLWIDDEFGRLDSVWAEQRLVDERAGLATLLPATHPGRGLTVEQMEQADAWPAKTVPGGGHGVGHGVEHRLGTTSKGNS